MFELYLCTDTLQDATIIINLLKYKSFNVTIVMLYNNITDIVVTNAGHMVH